MIVFRDFSFAIILRGSLVAIRWKNASLADKVQAKGFLSAMNNDCNMFFEVTIYMFKCVKKKLKASLCCYGKR